MAKIIIIILFYILLIPDIGLTAEKGFATIVSDQIFADENGEYIYASGDVIIQRGDTRIRTDSAFYDRKINMIYAFGKATFYRDFLGYGENLKYNLNTDEGYLNKGEIYIFPPDKSEKDMSLDKNELLFSTPAKPRQLHLWGKDIKILDKENFVIGEGGMTSCEGEKKPWHIEGRDISVKVEGYLAARDAKIYAGKLPVLYSPYFIAPAKKERQSGFLMPEFGLSKKDGFILYLPYYLVIDPSSDATINFKLKTNNSIGLDNQYRYMLSKNEGGELNLAVMQNYDKDITSYFGKWKHSKVADYNLKIDLGYLNRRDYFREYYVESDIKTMPYLRSSGFIEYEGKRDMLGANVFYTQATGLDSRTYQKFYLKKDAFLIPAGNNIHYNYNASLTSFVDRNGAVVERGMLEPFIFYSVNKGRYGIYADGRARANYYTQGQDKSGAVDKEIALFRAGAFLDKAYLVNDKYKVINTFRTEVLVPKAFNKDETVLASDKWDIFDETKKLSYVYEGKWYRHTDGKDIFYLYLSQDYLFSNRPGGASFSDVFFTLRRYFDYMNLDVNGSYDHEKGSFRTLNITNSINTKMSKINLSYFYSDGNGNFFNMDLTQKLGYNWSFIVGLRYDIKESLTNEVSTGVEYIKNCYSLRATAIKRENPREQLLFFSVNLLGLGEIKQNF
jgi:lipopolysaccharide assembly outer membrane protein LptD (OstA)